MSRVTIRKTWKTAEALGQLNYSGEAWQSYSDAISVLPPADNPFICVSVDSVLSTGTWAASVVYHVTYHMQFFQLQDPALTITPTEFAQRRQEEEEMAEKPDKKSFRQSSADDSFRSRVSKRK